MVVSLCAAIGLHWAALQSVAWVGMLFNYAHNGTVISAVEKTFDGRHPCPLCQAIEKGREQGKKQEFPLGGKIDMDYRPQAVTVRPPVREFEWPRVAMQFAPVSGEPAVPPPRSA